MIVFTVLSLITYGLIINAELKIKLKELKNRKNTNLLKY
jgi:hypothetical protein